jgi:hypothetical protein
MWFNAFLIFSWINFTVSDLTLRLLIHFELILVQDERLGPNFKVLQVEIQFSHKHLLKRLSFLQCVFWVPVLSCLDC